MSKQVPRSPPSTGFLGCFAQPAGVSVCSPAWTGAQRTSPRTSNIIDAFMFASIVVCSILPPRILARSHHCRPGAAVLLPGRAKQDEPGDPAVEVHGDRPAPA